MFHVKQKGEKIMAAKIISRPKVIKESFREPTEDSFCGHCEYWEYAGLDGRAHAYGYCNADSIRHKNEYNIVYARSEDCEIGAYRAYALEIWRRD